MEILSVGANLPFLINGDNYSPLGPAWLPILPSTLHPLYSAPRQEYCPTKIDRFWKRIRWDVEFLFRRRTAEICTCCQLRGCIEMHHSIKQVKWSTQTRRTWAETRSFNELFIEENIAEIRLRRRNRDASKNSNQVIKWKKWQGFSRRADLNQIDLCTEPALVNRATGATKIWYTRSIKVRKRVFSELTESRFTNQQILISNSAHWDTNC